MTKKIEFTRGEPRNVLHPKSPYNDVRIILSRHDNESSRNTKQEYGDAKIVCLETYQEFVFADTVKALALQRKKIQHIDTLSMPQLSNFHYVDFLASEAFFDEALIEVGIDVALTLIGSVALIGGVGTTILTRRKLLGSGATLLGGYLLGGPVNDYLTEHHTGTQLPWRQTEASKIFALRLRNLVMAHKIAFLSDMYFARDKKRPKIAFPVGAYHADLVKAFEIPKKERERLILEIVKGLKEKLPKEDYERALKLLYFIPSVEKDSKGKEVRRIINMVYR